MPRIMSGGRGDLQMISDEHVCPGRDDAATAGDDGGGDDDHGSVIGPELVGVKIFVIARSEALVVEG